MAQKPTLGSTNLRKRAIWFFALTTAGVVALTLWLFSRSLFDTRSQLPGPPTTSTQSWETYDSPKVSDRFRTFRLSYPDSWKITQETVKTTHPGQLELELEKDIHRLRIVQSPGSQASCLYPGDPDKTGMYVRYGRYKEIDKGGGVIWRRAMRQSNQLPDTFRYVVCEKKPGNNEFTGLTSIGLITLEGQIVADEQLLAEFDEMLQRIEIL